METGLLFYTIVQKWGNCPYVGNTQITEVHVNTLNDVVLLVMGLHLSLEDHGALIVTKSSTEKRKEKQRHNLGNVLFLV